MIVQLDTTIAPVPVESGEGKQIKLRNVTCTHKALGMETAEAWGLLEYEAPPHFIGPPLHWHATVAAFYVLEGLVTFRLGARRFTAQAGAFVLVPPGALHTFANRQERPARFLRLVPPGEFAADFSPDFSPADRVSLSSLC